MSEPIRLLGARDLAAAAAAVDLVGVVRLGLLDPLVGVGGCTLSPWPAGEDPGSAELVLLEDPVARFLVSAAGLRAAHTAALATLAARELGAPGAVRAVVLGTGAALRAQLTTVVRRLPSVRHLAVVTAGGPIDRDALDQIDLTSVTVSSTDDLGHALDGARLVIACGGLDWPDTAIEVAAGTTVVNAGGAALPATVVEAADQVFGGSPSLADVIGGRHPGRSDPGAVVVVDLPGAGALDPPLASALHRVALARGLWGHHLDLGQGT